MATLPPLSLFSNSSNSAQNIDQNNLNSNSNQNYFNSDITLNNTDDVFSLHQISRLFPFSVEITDKIIGYAYYMDAQHVVKYDDDTNEPSQNKICVSSSAKNTTGSRFSNLDNLMLVNSGFHFLCLQYQYKYCKFIRSFNFSKFLLNLINNPYLGNYIESLDFQEFTAVGLGKSIESICKIPNLTSVTLLKCLDFCSKNLKNLLLNESIDIDINFDVLNYIFNNLPKLKSLDFCGSSNDNFIDYFNDLVIENDLIHLENLSFHECLNFPTITYDKILQHTPNLKKLDLSHTQITIKSLLQFLNPNTKLTHLSLRKCTQLGTITDLIKLLQHPAVCGILEENLSKDDDIEMKDIEENSKQQLRWLNIQHCFSSNTLTCERLDQIIKIISSGAPDLKYLNLNGFANLNANHVEKICENLKQLQSLSICDVKLDPTDINDLNILNKLNDLPNLRFLDISNNLYNFTGLRNLIQTLDNIEVLEVKPYLTDNLSHVFNVGNDYWRVFNNKGISRRCWIHKLNNLNENQLYDNYENESSGSRLMEWDSNGNIIYQKIKKVDWLGLACVKINLVEDEFNTTYNKDLGETFDNDFGNDLSVRGLYKYYSLNV